MNQDQVKEELLKIEQPEEFFSVIFSGKESKRVDGLYKPDSREIIIHNKNMQNDMEIMYVAIHEFAHHIHFTTSTVPISSRAHTTAFYNIFHLLLEKAERLGVYSNIFKTDRRFIELTNRIKAEFLEKNGTLMKDFGSCLISAMELCRECNVRFDDYLDRELSLERTAAQTMMKISRMDLDPAIGYDNMKTVASLSNAQKREEALEDFQTGLSPDRVKAKYSGKSEPSTRLEGLIAEKSRIEKTINRLQGKLDTLEHQIQTMEDH